MQVVPHKQRFHLTDDCKMLGSATDLPSVSKEAAVSRGLKACFCIQSVSVEMGRAAARGVDRLFAKLQAGLESDAVKAEDIFRLQRLAHLSPELIVRSDTEKIITKARQSFDQHSTFNLDKHFYELIAQGTASSVNNEHLYREFTALDQALRRHECYPQNITKIWLRAWGASGDAKEATQAVFDTPGEIWKSWNNAGHTDRASASLAAYEGALVGCQVLESWVECLKEDFQEKDDWVLLLDKHIYEATQINEGELLWEVFAKRPSAFLRNVVALRVTYLEGILLESLFLNNQKYESNPVLLLDAPNENWVKAVETMIVLSNLDPYQKSELRLDKITLSGVNKLLLAWDPAKALEAND